AVRFRDGLELLARFREGDEEHPLATAYALEQELHAYGRLPRARVALEQVEAAGGETAADDVIETFDSRRDELLGHNRNYVCQASSRIVGGACESTGRRLAGPGAVDRTGR